MASFTMGLPGSSDLSADIFPMLMINIALSIGQIKHVVRSFMRVIGLLSASSVSRDPVDFSDEYNLSSGLILAGLAGEIRQALPLTVYGSDVDFGERSIADMECPVCLHEFDKEQEVRVLPLCRHVFHRGCLDRWLEHEQFTCPLCRSSVVPEEVLKKQQQREQDISEKLLVWFSSMRSSHLQGLWWYT